MFGGDEVSVVPDAPAFMDVQGALKAVLRAANYANGLAKGLHETAKALDKREAHFCVLADNCDEPMYVKLVEALCNEHGIPLIKIADKKVLGEWISLCKYDREGKPRKVVSCSCLAVKTYSTEEQGRAILSSYFNAKK